MAVIHDRSLTKKSGGRTRPYRKSKKYDLGSEFTSPEVGEEKTVTRERRGNTTKNTVKRAEEVNLSVDGEVKKV
ncbi:MAG: hypothetical protein R6U19_09340, partial [Bacteroidales bacterium]